MSNKDKGNQHFKKGQYLKAIKCYQQYVEHDHQDNKLAYCNMSLGYLKLKQYQKSVQAAQNALQQDRYFPKAYYRLVNAHKQISGHQYEVFINAALFLKNFQTLDQQRQKVLKIFNQYRQKLQLNNIKKTKKIDNSQHSIQKIVGAYQNLKDTNIVNLKSTDQQVNLNIAQLQQDIKWEQIVQITLNDYNYGINLAYYHLNHTKERTKTKAKIKQLKQYCKIQATITATASEKVITNHQNNINQSQQSLVINNNNLSLQQNTSNKQTQKQQRYSQTSKNQKLQQSEQINQTHKSQQIHKTEQSTKQQQNLQPIKSQKVQQKLQNSLKHQNISTNTAESIFSDNINHKQSKIKQISSKQYIDTKYQQFFGRLQQSRDICLDSYQGIINLLKSEESNHTKKQILFLLKTKKKDLQLVLRGCSKKQKNQIKQIATANQIDQKFIFTSYK